MHESIKAQLSFPDYYGKNLNALDECMLDDLIVPDAGGLVLVLNHYDRFSISFKARLDSGEGHTAEAVLSIFAKAVRYHMLFGRRLLVLVQSDDPKITFGRLGGVPACWNFRESLNKDRGF
jgi:RNAse (barnase) inhibitor barstar